jgi:hypothetical protein
MRQGNIEYADFTNAKMPNQFRVTHHKDVIPHFPLQWMGYHHQFTEMYEDGEGNIHQCNGSGEDPNCADQWGHKDWSSADHDVYLGIPFYPCVEPNEFLQ